MPPGRRGRPGLHLRLPDLLTPGAPRPISVDLAVALFADALLGGSAHRAGLCAVKAVAEVMTTGRGHILWSFFKASLWTAGFLALSGAFGAPPALALWPLDWLAPLGGLIFGIGAGFNGACSFSTLSRLAEGHLVMLFTLPGWLGRDGWSGSQWWLARCRSCTCPARHTTCPGSPSFPSPSGWDGKRGM